MLIYLAARYSRRDEVKGYAEHLKENGFSVDAGWLYGHQQESEIAKVVESATMTMPITARSFAELDYYDLSKADVLISFTESPRGTSSSRGGRHVEFGLALAWGKPLIIVGPRENVFHTLEQVKQFDSWGPEVIEYLNTLEGNYD